MKKFFTAFVLALALGVVTHNVAKAASVSKHSFTAMEKAAHSANNSFQPYRPRIRFAQNSGRRISPSAALRAARRVIPGSQGLGVRYLPGRQGYLVTLKTRGRIRRVFVSGRTGRVGR